MTRHGDFQKSLSCFLPSDSSREICMSAESRPGPLSNKSSCLGPHLLLKGLLKDGANLATCCTHLRLAGSRFCQHHLLPALSIHGRNEQSGCCRTLRGAASSCCWCFIDFCSHSRSWYSSPCQPIGVNTWPISPRRHMHLSPALVYSVYKGVGWLYWQRARPSPTGFGQFWCFYFANLMACTHGQMLAWW